MYAIDRYLFRAPFAHYIKGTTMLYILEVLSVAGMFALLIFVLLIGGTV